MSDNPLIPRKDPADDIQNAATELARADLERAYTNEPNAIVETLEAKTEKVLSKHQQFMLSLSQSGKTQAEIQTEWHHYYTTLSDAEKQEVWQEFYAAQENTPYQKLFQQRESTPKTTSKKPAVAVKARRTRASKPKAPVLSEAKKAKTATRKKPKLPAVTEPEAVKAIKAKVASKVSQKSRTRIKHHVQSLLFGLLCGFIVISVLLFTFFNEYIIAPFIQPSRVVSSAPIIASDGTVDLNAPPTVTIPKINVQIPLNFNVTTYDEDAVEAGLKTGVVHYANTAMPGQNGNAAYFGHSAVNIFNNGEKYGFAFTLLHQLTTGDTFYITYSGKTYVYQVFAREIVKPSDVGVIQDSKGKQATATLITCDPPGVSTNRLVIWGEQISPAPSSNTAAATPSDTSAEPTALAGNGPTLWTQFVRKLEFWK